MRNLRSLKDLTRSPAFRAKAMEEFFAAMMIGYAATNKPQKGTIAELPGSKLVLPYINGPWEVIDPYLVTPVSSRSGGMTVISYEGMPVWMMQYFGQYDDSAIPCLKAALRDAYLKKEFVGGRGMNSFRHANQIYYSNSLFTKTKGFDLFRGTEEITRLGIQLGFHVYQGGFMC